MHHKKVFISYFRTEFSSDSIHKSLTMKINSEFDSGNDLDPGKLGNLWVFKTHECTRKSR